MAKYLVTLLKYIMKIVKHSAFYKFPWAKGIQWIMELLMYQLLALIRAQVSNQNHNLIPEGSVDGVRSRFLAA